jgi:hypothetical protein
MNLLKLLLSVYSVNALTPLTADELRSMCDLTRQQTVIKVVEQVYYGVLSHAGRGLPGYHWTNTLDSTNSCSRLDEAQGIMIKNQLTMLFPDSTVVYNWPKWNDFDVYW